MGKRMRAPALLPDAGSPGSPEALWVSGDVCVAEYQRIVSSPDAAPVDRGRTSRPHGPLGPVICRHAGGLITKRAGAAALCLEGYVQRVLCHLAPGVCPEVRWIQKSGGALSEEHSITMQAGRDVSTADFGLSMVVQIADKLQELRARGAEFRHGDLHWGNVVRVNKTIERRGANPIKPMGEWSVGLWYNLRDAYRYKLIDFGMSTLALDLLSGPVELHVPNDIYPPPEAIDDQHDLRCLLTAMWQTLWVRGGPDGLVKRKRGERHYREWFPWFLDCIVRRAAALSEDYALVVDLDAHAKLARRLGGVPRLCADPRLLALYNLCPEQWASGRAVPIAHCLYASFPGGCTPIFAPRNVVALCCWAKWRHDEAWFAPGGRARNHVYEFQIFSRFCADNGF